MNGVDKAVLSALALGISAVLAGAQPVSAKILCRGAFQIVGGQPIATPYCEDSNVAEVAREYGIHVSAREVRSNPGTKARICRFIGQDNRVRSACAGYIDNVPKRWF